MEHAIQAVIALLAITNPLGNAPIFFTFTEQATSSERRRDALRACVAVFVILTVAALAGQWILRVFGISFPAFQAAGGLVVSLMGLEMLRGNPSKIQHDHNPAEDQDDPMLIPLAMPLIAGPGAITTVITLSTRGSAWSGITDALIAVVVTTAALFLALVSSSWLAKRLSERADRIFLRFMGLILLAVGAQLLLAGVRSFMTGHMGL